MIFTRQLRISVIALIFTSVFIGATYIGTARAGLDDEPRPQPRRYNTLEGVLTDLQLILGRANGNGALPYFQRQIDEAFAAWPEIAEQFPSEATDFDPAFQTYRDIYRDIKKGNYREASALLARAPQLINEGAQKIAARDQAERKKEIALRAPPKGQPFELHGDFKITPDNYPKYPARPVVQGPGFARIGVPYKVSGEFLQGGIEKNETRIPWEPWRVKVFNLVEQIFSQNLATYRHNKGALFPKRLCTYSYTIAKSSPGIYPVSNIKMTQSSGDPDFDRIAGESLWKLDNYHSQPPLIFPAGTKRTRMELTTSFVYNGKRIYNPRNDVENVRTK